MAQQRVSTGSGLKFVDVIIANGASVSEEVATFGASLVGIFMSSSWTAATITFLGSRDAADTPLRVSGDGTTDEKELKTVAAAEYLALNKDFINFVPFLTLRSGTATTPVNQGAARTLKLVFYRP